MNQALPIEVLRPVQDLPFAYLPVEAKHCHHALRHNAFITRASQTGINEFDLIAEVDHINENFFFDHEIDHIPGMLTANMIRQSVLVVCHLFLGVPFTKKFLMDNLEIKFHGLAKLNHKLHLYCKLPVLIMKGSFPKKARLFAEVVQDGVSIASGFIDFRIYDPEAMNRLKEISQLHKS
ncbi:MAG: hypothetical protein HY072_02705 [Deltaproteobacteria bacterium]|nr:hypothetical protein [Deltaproteobacteria bacterium]